MIERRLPVFRRSALGANAEGSNWDLGVCGGPKREGVREVFEENIAKLDFHGGTDVDLEAKDSFEGAAFFIEVDEVGGLMAVDPVLVVVSTDKNAVVVPHVGLEFFDRYFSDNPRFPFLIDDDFLSGIGENSSATFVIDHAVLVRWVLHNVELVTGDDVEIDFRAHFATILNTAVGAVAEFDFHLEFEVLNG